METYLLDTSALTPLIDSSHTKHDLAKELIFNIKSSPIYVSVLALAEIMYGFELYERTHRTKLPNAEQMLSEAQLFPRLDVEHHTAAEYAALKATIASHYLPKESKDFRTK